LERSSCWRRILKSEILDFCSEVYELPAHPVFGRPESVGTRVYQRRRRRRASATALTTAGGRADRACFACPLQSHRIGGRRHITGLESDRGEIVGARQATVQCSKELAAERGPACVRLNRQSTGNRLTRSTPPSSPLRSQECNRGRRPCSAFESPA
jgi:hypothetical protein